MSKKESPSNRMDIDAFLAERMAKQNKLPKEALDDIRYFALRAKEGAVISQRGMSEWMEKKYGIAVGRTRLFNATKAAGVQPWWTK